MAELRTHERYSNAGNTTYEIEVLGGIPRQASAAVAALLCPGTRVLDVGCGPGNLTVAYAPLVAPAEVVGIDFQDATVEAARDAAIASGVANARFERASVYDLPFEDESFDCVIASLVFFHLGRPFDALAEVQRVLAPGGHVVLGDVTGVAYVWPPSEAMDRLHHIDMAVVDHNGGDTRFGLRQRDVLSRAGFEVMSHTAESMLFSGPMAEQWVDVLALRFQGDGVRSAITEAAMASPEELTDLFAAARSWSTHPEAAAGQVFALAVARKP